MSAQAPTHLPVSAAEATRLARRLERAERRSPGALAGGLRQTADLLVARGLAAAEAEEAALLLLAVGLRERGLGHAQVTRRLRRSAPDDDATVAAFRSAAWMRAHRPDLDPERVRAARRRAAAVVFLAFAAWGALGVELLTRAAG